MKGSTCDHVPSTENAVKSWVATPSGCSAGTGDGKLRDRLWGDISHGVPDTCTPCALPYRLHAFEQRIIACTFILLSKSDREAVTKPKTILVAQQQGREIYLAVFKCIAGPQLLNLGRTADIGHFIPPRRSACAPQPDSTRRGGKFPQLIGLAPPQDRYGRPRGAPFTLAVGSAAG